MHKKKVIDLQNYRVDDADPVEESRAAAADYLRPGTTLLFGQYTIIGYLNCGGFGITYLAQDSLGRKVAVKECFPGELCYRSGNEMRPEKPAYKTELESIVDHFVKEAQRVASLKHDNIVHVHQIFEENATAYMVMDFIDGPDLLDVADGHAPVPAPSDIEVMTEKLLRAIAFVHDRGFLHRDISPDNILLGPDCEPVLIDFGSARQSNDQTPRRPSRLKFVKDGYSPQEFYIPGREQGPWSDLYSFAASLHHVIVGYAPEDGQTRLAALAAKEPDPYQPLSGRVEHFPPRFLEAIDKALEVLPDNRIQSADDWLAYLGKEAEAPVPRSARPVSLGERSALLSLPVEALASALVDKVQSRNSLLMGGAAAALLVTAGLVGFGLYGSDSSASDVIASAPVASGEVVEDAPLDLALLEPVEPEPRAPVELKSMDSIVAAIELPRVDTLAPAAIPTAPEVTTVATETDTLAAPIGEGDLAAMSREAPGPRMAALVSLPEVVGVELGAPRVAGALVDASFAAPLAGELNIERAKVLPGVEWTTVADLPVAPVDVPVAALPSLPGEPVVGLAFVERMSFTPATIQLTALNVVPETKIALASDLPTLPSVVGDAVYGGDVAPPKYIPKLGPLLETQVTYSHWDVDMPFDSTPKQVRNANTVTITSVNADTDLAVSGTWIKEGTVIYAFNGARLQPDVALSVHVLNAFNMDPDGFVRATVRYRDPDTGTIDRGLLAVPLVRQIGLADGSLLEARMVDLAWQLRVVEPALGSGLAEGDLVLGLADTGKTFEGHDDLAQALDQLVAQKIATADLLVSRDGTEQQVAWQLLRATE